MKNELNFPSNFERLVLGCIEVEFCKKILVGKLLTRSTRFTFMRLLEKRTEVENEIMNILLHRSNLTICGFSRFVANVGIPSSLNFPDFA